VARRFAGVAILLLLARASQPHVAYLGRIPGTRHYSDLERHPENEPLPNLVAFRPEASLLYVNADSVLQSVLDRVRAMGPGKIRLVVCDLSASPYIDLAGSRMLHQFHTELGSHGINLRIVGARGRVRDLLRAEGIDEKVGGSTGAKPSTSFWKAPARMQPGRHYPRGNHVEREDRRSR
jgi:sulfate permease, SulP family